MRENKNYQTARRYIILLILLLPQSIIHSQPICTPWGNIKGVAVEGELMSFETSLRSVNSDWSGFVKTEKYNWEGTQTYDVVNDVHTVSHALQGLPLEFRSIMQGESGGQARVDLSIKATEAFEQAGTFFCFEVPGSEFAAGTLDFYNGNRKVGTLHMPTALKQHNGEFLKVRANRVVLTTPDRQYEVSADKNTDIIVRQDFLSQPYYINDPLPRQTFVDYDEVMKIADIQLYFTMIRGNASKGVARQATYTVTTNGTIDREDIQIEIDPKKPGREFVGIGGNYRNQFPDKDPMVIDYCLDSLRVSWGRISMWWENWHPNEDENPMEQALAGKLPEHLYRQFEIARMLKQRDIPIIVSVWHAPHWAIDHSRRPPKGSHLNEAKMEQIVESIALFLEYMKQEYGVEAALFSFNETDCGVEILQTPQEHATFNKAIGSHLALRGLSTKMMIGDSGFGTAKTSAIVRPTIDDPSIHPYIGALAFHTYHGCTTPDLEVWFAAGRELNVPVMVTEGGDNSASHRYPLVFLQPWFQHNQMDMYIRICKVAQPLTIMEWQLTSDYSVLTGAGLYGDDGELRPTQRFWNLKQLGATPIGSFALPVTCSSPTVTTAAYGDIAGGVYTLHMVNNGATRKVTFKGLPANVSSMQVFVTDAEKGMELTETIQVENGIAVFSLIQQSYTTLINLK